MEQVAKIINDTITNVKLYARKIYKQDTDNFKLEVIKYLLTRKNRARIEKKYLFYDREKLNSIDLLYEYLNKQQDLQEIFELLENQESREIFIWILQFRIAYLLIGSYAMDIYPLKESSQIVCPIKKTLMSYIVKDYKIKCGYEIYDIWGHNQYALEGICEPERGDIIISAGALNGETSIWLADKVGHDGKVYAFEPTPKSFKILSYNIKRNHKNDIIKAIRCGLWNCDQRIYLHKSTRAGENWCSSKRSKFEIEAVTIDSFLSKNLEKVDMIKMDIEGSEFNALLGAKETIKLYNPKLAISIYHLHKDLIRIPKLIKEINNNYKIYLSHKSKSGSEIIMFARIDKETDYD